MKRFAIVFLIITSSANAAGPLSIEELDHFRMTGQYDKAIAGFQEILDLSHNNVVEAKVGLAQCYIDTGRYDDAISIVKSPEDMTEHLTRAKALQAVGRYREALVSAKSAILPEPDYDSHWGAVKQLLDSRITVAQIYETLGQRKDAIAHYEWFDRHFATENLPRIKNPESLTAIGTGYLRYNVLTRNPKLAERIQFVLNDIYQHAYENIDRHYWPARLAAADLLRSRHHIEQAVEDYEAALKINPNIAAAHTGLGWIALNGWNFELCEQKIEQALGCNPNFVDAHILKSALRLTERKYDDALAAAESALKINPNSVFAMGHAAAAHAALNHPDRVTKLRKRAESVTPTPADFHRPLADSLAARRQYAASETEYELAIKYDPTDPHPRTELGLMYMQWGREEKARTALTAAWKLDPFDARTLNVLNLLNELAEFETLETKHFIIAHSHPIDAVLATYLADYLEDIHEELCLDFNAELNEKTIIELFGSHRAFGVRITGKPWIHTVGACTGRVIAIESPRTDPDLQGPFHIARVLRHEFTHTVTLAATENRIPHWFTEGLAVMQEDAPPAFSWRQQLADALRRDRLFTLESIDWGFIRPRRPGDRQLAYAQSEWMCQFIVDRFGYTAIENLIAAYKRRQAQTEAIQGVLNISQTEFDTQFRVWAKKQVAEWGFSTTPPDDVDKLAFELADARDDDKIVGLKCRLALAQLDAGDIESALPRARDVLRNHPNEKTCLNVLGESLLTIRNQDANARDWVDRELSDAMPRLLSLDSDGWVAPKALGLIALDNSELDEAIKHFKHLARVRPVDPASARGLASAYLAKGEVEAALPHLTRLADEIQDDADIPTAIADIHAANGRLHDARYWYLQSIYIDAFNLGTHRQLLDVCEKLKDEKCIAREHASLCQLETDAERRKEHCDAANSHKE